MYNIMPFERVGKNTFDFFDEMEKKFFGDVKPGFVKCRTDIIENDNAFILQAELPGFSKEDIQINIEGEYLTLSAQHKEENDEKDDKGNFVKRERYYGTYSRTFNVNNIDADHISASYNNGVLELTLPKMQAKEDEVRKIEVQ